MSQTPQPNLTTQYPHGEPSVITAPMNQAVALDTLLQSSTTIANLQAQINSLAARVTALENAAS